ncbi:hypothetical protein ABZ470_31680 [Streptosporangium sp. NPDC020072]|uniref:hypothetical protein n=1 Tax=Streptosporangium sp. NPDC020072 TaxID=3154788 RepID=UPI00342BB453
MSDDQNTSPTSENEDVTDPGMGDEKNWKTVSKERDDLQQASMSEAEKAITAAREEGRAEGLTEALHDRVEAALIRKAAKEGREIPDAVMESLNLGKFASDGKPDSAAIEAFISSLPARQSFAPANDLGIGQRAAGTGQLSRDDLKSMSPAEIWKAREEGRLDNLLGGTT